MVYLSGLTPTVIEPQQVGRLQWHKMVYFSGLTPTLSNRIGTEPCHERGAFGPVAPNNPVIHWHKMMYLSGLKQKEFDRYNAWQCAGDIHILSAGWEYHEFVLPAEKKAMLTNMNIHGFSCEKTKKGRLMCCFCCPAVQSN
jgi:hypothetical protein